MSSLVLNERRCMTTGGSVRNCQCGRCGPARKKAVRNQGEEEAAPGVPYTELAALLGVTTDPAVDPPGFVAELRAVLDGISGKLGGAPQLAEGDLTSMEEDFGTTCPDGYSLVDGECIKPKRREGPDNPQRPAGNRYAGRQAGENDSANLLPSSRLGPLDAKLQELTRNVPPAADLGAPDPSLVDNAGRFYREEDNLLPSSRLGPLDAKLADIERERRERQARRRGWTPEPD